MTTDSCPLATALWGARFAGVWLPSCCYTTWGDTTTGEVTFKSGPDFERPADATPDNTYEIVVTASDRTNSVNKNVSIKVLNVEEAPVFTSRTTGFTNENRSMEVYKAGAFDPEGGAVTLSITGGVDARFLQITNPADGVVTFKIPPDFETPRDDDGDNVYQFTVTASDGRNTTSLDVAISVYDLVETLPSFTSGSTAFTNENTLTSVYKVTGSKADSGGSLTYSISGGVDAGLFNIDSETGDVTFKNAPNYEAPMDKDKNNAYTFTVMVTDGLKSTTKNVTITVNDVPDANKPPSDFNGDGKSDILLQDGGNGDCFVWQMNGLQLLSDKSFGYVGWTPPNKNWHAVGTGDFDGDGKSDILLQDGATNDCLIWGMNGLKLNKDGYVVGKTDAGHGAVVKATGDFDGDGKSDILLQDANGDCYVWLMNGLNATASAKVGWTPPNNGWTVAGTGDFNGDGKSDILLRDGSNGDCFVWEMDGLNLLSDKSHGYVGWKPPNTNWTVAGVGDFNGDGKSDILLRDGSNGDCFVWEMNGLKLLSDKSYGYVGWTPPNAQWTVAGVADFNGDGKSDILLRDGANGNCFVWEMDGLKLLSDNSFGYVGWMPPNADWHAMA